MKNRIFICTLLLIILLPVWANAYDSNAMGAVGATTLNVRTEPSTNAEIIGTLKNREKVNIITKTDVEWYKINYNGQEGYIHISYVTVSRSGEPVVYNKEADMSWQSVEGMQKGQQVVEYAKQFLGVPYVYGGSRPGGFDCSGLVQYVYKNFGVMLNRVAADQTAHGIPVYAGDLKAGDIVFFHNTSKYTRINHVGIYVGDGMFIHAPQTGDVVKFSPLNSGYYSTTFVTARRIFE